MPSANKTPNYELNQWQGNEYIKRQDLSDDNAAIDAAIKARADDLAAHKADETVHVTTLACTKSTTVYALTGLTATTGAVPVMFKAPAAYADGDTVTVNGTAYTIKTRDGSTLTASAWAAGVYIHATADVDVKTLTVEPSAPVGSRPATWTPTAAQVGAVNKSGDTMTGDLTLSKYSGKLLTQDANGAQAYILNNTSSSADYGTILGHQDKNGVKTEITLSGGNANVYTNGTPVLTTPALRNIQATSAQASSFLGQGVINVVIS